MTVYGNSFRARFWYDGKFLDNAKEDAAEVAMQWLNNESPTGLASRSSTASSPSTSRSGW